MRLGDTGDGTMLDAYADWVLAWVGEVVMKRKRYEEEIEGCDEIVQGSSEGLLFPKDGIIVEGERCVEMVA